MNGQSSDAIDAPADVTLPLPANEMFGRMHLQTGVASVPDALQKITVPANVIQEFRPVAESLEWELGQLYWKIEGVLPFLRNEVPFMINNDGLLAEAAAVLLFANCGEVSNPGTSIPVLELGAGTGLFARFFLDTFKAICEQEQTDYYKRLVYFITDSSRQTVAHWAERNLFSKHPSQVVLGICDAANPGMVEDLAGSCHEVTKARAVICNYVLDVLPSALIRRQQDRMERLCVRTHLSSDAALVRQYTSLAPEEIRGLAESPRKEDRERLIPLMSLFGDVFLCLRKKVSCLSTTMGLSAMKTSARSPCANASVVPWLKV